MSGIVTGWLWNTATENLEPTATNRSLLLVMAVLADRADNSGRGARVPIRDIARRTLLSERYVASLLARALLEGWVEVTVPGNARRPTEYRFTHFHAGVESVPKPVEIGSRERPSARRQRALRAPQSAVKRAPQSARSARSWSAQDVKTVNGLTSTSPPTPTGARRRSAAMSKPAPAPAGDPHPLDCRCGGTGRIVTMAGNWTCPGPANEPA